MKMTADQLQTKAVDRHDLRIVDQRRLSLKMRIVGVTAQCLFDGICDPFPHTGCSRVGKGNDK